MDPRIEEGESQVSRPTGQLSKSELVRCHNDKRSIPILYFAFPTRSIDNVLKEGVRHCEKKKPLHVRVIDGT